MNPTDTFAKGFKKVTGRDCGCKKRAQAMKQQKDFMVDALKAKFGSKRKR